MPPIVVKKFDWHQNDDYLFLNIPYTIKPNDADIFLTATYLKVHTPPYFFELFLQSTINEENSKCYITETEIVFELEKETSVEWPGIAAEISKDEQRLRRQEIDEEIRKRSASEKERKKVKLHEIQQLAIKEQMDLDSSNRQNVENKKEAERKKIDAEIEESKKVDDHGSGSHVTKGNASVIKTKSRKISQRMDEFPIPLPRECGTIKIRFTSREFPTPSRESKHEEEQEWLKKQLKARQAAGFVAEDLRPEECDPVWLKQRGDTFHSQGNYLGAISAYSHAIKIGSKLPALFSNRAACHIALGNLHKALEDVSEALELLTPPVAANEEARARCHARRAVVLCKLGLPEKSISDFQMAMTLLPNDIELRADYEKALYMIEHDEESASD